MNDREKALQINEMIDLVIRGVSRRENPKCYEDLTDLGNLERFKRLMGDDWKYDMDENVWIKWNGNRWENTHTDKLLQPIYMVMDDLNKEISVYNELRRASPTDSQSTEMRKATNRVRQWKTEIQSSGRINGLIKLLQKDEHMRVSSKDFESDKYLFGVANGVVNLQTGELMKNDRSLMTMMSSPIEYNSKAKAPKWIKTLMKMCEGDEEKVKTIQILFGSAMLGEPPKFFIFFKGVPDSGKTTITQVILMIFGDYGTVSDPKTITDESKSDYSYFIAKLQHKRLVVFNETNKESLRLTGDVVKKLVATEQEIQARHIRGNPFTFMPTATPFFTVNHMPETDKDEAMMKRLKALLFKKRVPKNEIEDNFITNLVNEEGPGILNWMIEGCIKYQQEGLIQSESAIKEEKKIFDESDHFANFIEEVGRDTLDGEFIKDIRKDYTDWCSDNGMTRKYSSQSIKLMLEEREIPVEKYRNQWKVKGNKSPDNKIRRIGRLY
jgi:putative DNA primase/helicase